jgi:hypothetical protein
MVFLIERGAVEEQASLSARTALMGCAERVTADKKWTHSVHFGGPTSLVSSLNRIQCPNKMDCAA